MKYKKIWKYQPYRTSRREQDYQQVQEFLKSGDPELWKALYESAYEIVYQCAYGMDFCRVLDLMITVRLPMRRLPSVMNSWTDIRGSASSPAG